MDCPSAWRGDAVTTAPYLNQQHRGLLLDRSAMSYQAWSPAKGVPTPERILKKLPEDTFHAASTQFFRVHALPVHKAITRDALYMLK
jgi:hypothetical protein